MQQVLAPFAIGMVVFLCHLVAIPLDGCRSEVFLSSVAIKRCLDNATASSHDHAEAAISVIGMRQTTPTESKRPVHVILMQAIPLWKETYAAHYLHVAKVPLLSFSTS